jgi:SAM-dependent methyltransferase
VVGAAGVRDWYEEVWRELPADLDPPEFETRRDFLLAHVRAGERVLDLGCGDGDFTAALAATGNDAVGADVAEAARARARARHPELEFVRIEPHGPFPFADGEFDVVWASEVMEHVADTERWVNEVRRVLRSGGKLLVTTPNAGALRRLLAPPDPRGQHLRFYTRRSLRDLLKDMGFTFVRVRRGKGRALFGSAVR